jgi:hypothetical protein
LKSTTQFSTFKSIGDLPFDKILKNISMMMRMHPLKKVKTMKESHWKLGHNAIVLCNAFGCTIFD